MKNKKLKPFVIVVIWALALWMNGCSSARANLDFKLVNLTGTPLKNVYLSPSASSGWEENILAGSELRNGDTIKIKFNPNETAMTWDLRIESPDGGYAEWKNLELVDISEIKLEYSRSPQPTAIAEIE